MFLCLISAVLLNVNSRLWDIHKLPFKRVPSGEAEIIKVAILSSKTGNALNQLCLELYVLTVVCLLVILTSDVCRLFVT